MVKHLLLAGCGRMGSAMLFSWLSRNTVESVRVVDPASGTLHDPRLLRHASLSALAEDFIPDVVLFAVKPQQLDAVLPEYAARFGALPLYISIAAGKPLAYYAKHLKPGARIIRAMPNTPAMVGQGTTALIAGSTATAKDRATAEALFNAFGSTLWLETEETMHAVTALSGSGPAYVFLFLESLTRAGVEAGLSETAARDMALQTVAGSCELAKQNGGDFARLRADVTSPGGTTEAALKALTSLPEIIKTAINQNIKRSKELASI